MTKQIETIMALADSFAEYHDHSEYVHARARLRQALEAALKPGEAQCKWPTCQTEEYQQKLGDDVVSELIGAPPAPTTVKDSLTIQEPEPACNPHPKAPHGFDRNGSHSADRYVCECEHWEPYDAGYQKGLQDGLERAYALQEISDIGQLQEAPPRREPLSDEQINKLQLAHVGVTKWFPSVVRAIEAAHGITGEKT